MIVGRRGLAFLGMFSLALVVTYIARGTGQPLRVATIPGSSVRFEEPRTWHSEDPAVFLDPGWAEDQKVRYPADAAFIDATVAGFRSGRFAYAAWIDLDGNGQRDSGVQASVSTARVPPASLASEALDSVRRQPAVVLPGTTAVDVILPGGPAARLDWRYTLRRADGTDATAFVRAYWVLDRDGVVAVQFASYGDRPTSLPALESFEAAIQTMRWEPE
jgi:hypothetical protein